MPPAHRFARVFSGRVHYAWIIAAVSFTVILIGVGVRAAPSVLLVPLEQSFGWSADTIAGAVSLNILLLGLTGPFAVATMQTFGLRRTMIAALVLLTAGAGGSALVRHPWQLYLTWGLLVGLGASATGFGIIAIIANRWFVARRGLVTGLLTASNASGQLVFLPALAALATSFGWVSVPIAVSLLVAAMIPLVWLLLAESPGAVGIGPYGAREEPPTLPTSGNPFRVAFGGLARGAGSVDFWLLAGSFAVCGFSTYGLIGTHMIAYCMDHGIPEVTAAGLMASLGVFDLFGTICSGWLTDRYNPRVLLFWYYSLRGLSLLLLPFTQFNLFDLSIFAVFYGLDWVATVPPTITLTNAVFGRKDGPVIVSWIFCAHQVGGSLAAVAAGAVRDATGSYMLAFLASGAACLMASLLVLGISRKPALAAVG
ncbi:MAG TPA: MFS transporter [Acetobacteraceae bacterium]|nr:MFS transporter [Acetobacteraceae bacterium]